MGRTEIVPKTADSSQRSSDAKHEKQMEQCIRYIKVLRCALIVIITLCLAIIGVLSWHLVRSESEDSAIKTNGELYQNFNETTTNIDMNDVRKLKDDAEKRIDEVIWQLLAKVVYKDSSADISSLQATVKKQEEKIRNLETKFKEPASAYCESASTYTRWGRSDCPANGTELVYDGYVGGSWFNQGSASNYVCLTKEPLWDHVQNGTQNDAMMYGAEYQFAGHGNGKDFFGKNLLNLDVPCSVCRTIRPTVIMIPGRNRCFDSWTLEYNGYLAANYFSYRPTEYTCIDKSPTAETQATHDQNGALFYLVEAICGSLKCPPYIDGAELTCAVCSK